MSDFIPPKLSPRSGVSDGERIYRGTSMFRVFSPGDILTVKPLRAGEAQKGDIICFEGPRGETVHRVVRKSATKVVTMGDNNRCPDIEPLNSDARVWLVTERRDAAGKLHKVGGGSAGLFVFRVNRGRRAFRWFFDRLAGVLRRVTIIKYPLRHKTRFGGDEIFYFGGKPVLHRDASGKETWLSPWYRVVFKAGAK